MGFSLKNLRTLRVLRVGLPAILGFGVALTWGATAPLPPPSSLPSAWAHCVAAITSANLLKAVPDLQRALPVNLANLPSGKLNYRVEVMVGQGGYAEVFRAVDLASQQPVALKVIGPQVSRAQEHAVHEFEMQRMAFSGATGRHVAQPLAVLSENGLNIIAMEFIGESTSLAKLTGQGSLPEEIALPLLIRLVEAVKNLHDQEIVHGDLKPENVQVTERDVLVFDFGLSFVEGKKPEILIQPGIVFGTPPFLSPEMIESWGEHHTRADDLWALGVIFFRTLTGKGPFTYDSPGRFSQLEFKSRGQLIEVPGVAPDLAQVIQTMLHPSVESRYPDAGKLLQALKVVQARRPAGGSP